MKSKLSPLLLPALVCLVLASVIPAQAESSATMRLRALAEQSAANQNATTEEKAATRSLSNLLSGAAANSEATGKAALALSEIALGKGNLEQAKSLAEAVLDMVAGSSTGMWGSIATQAKTLLGAANTLKTIYAADAPATDGEVPFVDADLFDRKLSQTLAAKPDSVVVAFPAPVNMKKIPERLDKWFSAVEKGGGKIDTVAVPETGRGVLSLLFDLAVKVFELLNRASLYDPAKDYDATVYYKSPSGTLVKVVFTRRAKG